MTGTAQTEAAEFNKVYNVGVVQHPDPPADDPRGPVRRHLQDREGQVQRGRRGHRRAAPAGPAGPRRYGQRRELRDPVHRCCAAGASPHSVLNAKYHAKEAEIIAQAGRKGGVTVATNMAGRGTDILLGGNPEFLAAAELRNRGPRPGRERRRSTRPPCVDAVPRWKKQCDEEADEVVEAGGLYVLGTERHDSRRIDNQLRGRSGRQGDPGESRFYLSLQDELMRASGPGAVEAVMDRFNIPEDVPIESKMVSSPDQERADPDRGAERRDPQERPQVRRGAQQAAPGHLRRAQAGARR